MTSKHDQAMTRLQKNVALLKKDLTQELAACQTLRNSLSQLATEIDEYDEELTEVQDYLDCAVEAISRFV